MSQRAVRRYERSLCLRRDYASRVHGLNSAGDEHWTG